MVTKRIILNFEEKVYCEESRVWYVLDYQATPFIKDVINDVVKHLKCCKSWRLYVNDVLAPEWTLSSVICSENDTVKLIRSRKDLPLSDKAHPANLSNPSESVIASKCVEQFNADSFGQSKIISNDPAKEQKLPLKINNNYKRKFCDTTPTHKDRYTNRSKIYVSPVLPKAKTVPVANALKTAVKETLTYSSSAQRKKDGISNCKTVTDSIQKTRTFHDKVTNILNHNSTIAQADSDSDSSMTSSSSENESEKRNSKKRKENPMPVPVASSPVITGKISKKPVPSSSSSSESEPDATEDASLNPESKNKVEHESQCMKMIPIKPSNHSQNDSSEESSEEESDKENTNVTRSVDPLKHNLKMSESERESEDENSGAVKNSAQENSSLKKDSSEGESSEDESCDEEVNSKMSTEEKNDSNSQSGHPKDYDKFENLEGTPRVSDKLAFKMLDLNESYCPVISAYKEGIITEYDSSSQNIVVKLFPQFQKAQQSNGRFAMDDSLPSETIELNLKQLIEPKLIV